MGATLWPTVKVVVEQSAGLGRNEFQKERVPGTSSFLRNEWWNEVPFAKPERVPFLWGFQNSKFQVPFK